jgi:hypothetical protein
MEELIHPNPAFGFPSSMPFIVSSNIDGVDQATRKLIRSHVMRGKKQKRTKGRPQADRKPIKPTQNTQVKLQDVIDRYMILQPGRVGTHMYFMDYPSDIEPSMLLKMAEGS